jgi:predicted RNase H-like HicB family nuclease
MEKTIKYYMTLRYPIEVNEISEEEGGGFSACIPLLGRYSCVADGDSAQEAIENLGPVKQDLIEDLLDRGLRIPEPQSSKESEFSGRLLVRMPRDLHMRLTEKAESKDQSLNRYIVDTLSASTDQNQTEDIKNILTLMTRTIESLLGQINSYSPAVANRNMEISDVVIQGIANNVIPAQLFMLPNTMIFSTSRYEVVGSAVEGFAAQGGVSPQKSHVVQ